MTSVAASSLESLKKSINNGMIAGQHLGNERKLNEVFVQGAGDIFRCHQHLKYKKSIGTKSKMRNYLVHRLISELPSQGTLQAH